MYKNRDHSRNSNNISSIRKRKMDEKEKSVSDKTNTVPISDEDHNENAEKEVRKRAPAAHRWHQFRILTPTSAILRGSYAMTHLRFKPRSRGNQGSPCSVVAIVFSRLSDPKNWTKTTVDEILQHGDKLFSISATRNRVSPGVYMRVGLVFPEFYIDENKCTICANEGSVFGNLFTESIGCPDFSDGLQRFFKANDAGVITAQGTSVAMWRHPRSGFFYFDPSPRGEDGTKCPSGVACVLRFKCMNDMRDHFLGNMDKRYDSRYCIANVTVLKVSPVRRGPFDTTRLKIMASKHGGTSSCSLPQKKTLKCLRSLDFEKENSSCAKKGTRIGPKDMELKKEPLTITISNYSIDARFASQPLVVDQNHFETGYDYYDMHVNVPSTFKELTGNMAILHGWTHEGSEMYKGKGGQNVANCVTAIGMKKIHGVKSWLRPKLDEILALGDKMYGDVRAEKPGIKSMTANDLNETRVKIEERKLVVDVDLMTIVGTLNSKVSSVLNLKQALEEFFLVNTDGVLECTSMAVAVWTQDDCYYMFDPRQCGPLGIRIVEVKGKGRRGKGGKAGKGDGGEKKLKGKCCVIRFPDIDSLVGLFVKNVDQAKRNDRFTLRHVSVVDDVPGTRSWNEFGPGEPGKWVLRGSIANDDDVFEDESRGLQGPAIPVVGLVKANELGPSKWTGETIDEAIRDGDAYYNWSQKFWGTEDEERKIVVTDLRRDFYMKNRKVKVDLQDSSVVGNLKASTEGEELDLSRGIAQFFDNHKYGVVQIGDLWVAIWKHEEELKDKSKETTYYYFDSNPRGKLGKRNVEDDEEAVACVLRTPDLTQLTKFIEENVDPEIESHEFAIHAVRVIGVSEPMSDEELQLDMKTPMKPELKHYTAVGDDAACLSGSFNQGNELIFKHQTRNKQQAATSLVALAMTKIYSSLLWYSEVLDEILKIGDKVTADNLENLPEFGADEENPREYLHPNEIDEDFNIGVNRISFELEEESASGRITDLTEALEGYFETNTHGVFSCDSVIIPLWKEGSVYFMMDPKGRDNFGVPTENEGTAVVMWFLSPAGLANSLQASIGTTDATFTIDNVIVENTYETRVAEAERPQRARSAEELWYHFPKTSEGVWAFSGEVGLTDEKFPEENRANQTAAVAVMAVVFSKVYEPRYWKPEVLNEVIVTGDRLHSKCVERLGRNDPRVNEIVTEFFLSNRRIDLSMKDCVQAGDLAGRPPKVQDLQTGIDKFFEKNVSGALSSCGTNIGLWKFNGFFYALIPRSLAGGDLESDAPRVLRCADTRLLVENLLSNLKEEGDYEITGIEVVDWNKLPPWKYDPSPAVRPANLPTLNAYRRLPNARAILRGTIHQASEIFPQLVRNKQTAANCVVALGLSVIKSPITWTAKSLDEILVIGKNVHSETLKARPSRAKVRPKDVIRVFYVGVNVLTADVEEGTVSGLVAIEPPKPEVKGKKGRKGRIKKATNRGKKGKKGKTKRERPPPPPPIFLEQGIPQFFEKNRAGILVAGRYMVAIWKDLGVYFVYDPRSSDGIGSRTVFGTSCVMWFACLEPLYDLIFSNLEDHEKYGLYTIDRVILKTTILEALPCPAGFRPIQVNSVPPIPLATVQGVTTLGVETLSEYAFVDENLSILRGALHLQDYSFSVKSRGFQSTAVAAVAVVVGLLHVPSTWTAELLGAVVKYGDALHNDSTRVFHPGARTLSPSELLTVFVVGDVRANIHVHCHTVAGLLHTYDLAEGLTLFFRNNCSGILHLPNLAVAVMQHYGKFYLVDPYPHDEYGRTSFDGASCVMKCDTIGRMAEIFVSNCNYKRTTLYTLNAVNILSLHFFSQAKSQCAPICSK